jgi:hypothetical protein
MEKKKKLFKQSAIDSDNRVCPHCGKCHMNYDYDGSYLNWECQTFPYNK